MKLHPASILSVEVSRRELMRGALLGLGALALPTVLASCGTSGNSASGAGGGTSATSGVSGLDAVLAAAKKEGQAVWFLGSGKYTAEQQAAIGDAFEKKFGFPLKVTLASGGSVSQTFARLGDEAAAGIPPTYDVVNGGAIVVSPLRKAGATVGWDWAGMGVPKEHLVSEIPGALYLFDNPRTPCYNTDKLSAADLPKTWQDLLDPKWKGKIVTGSTPSIWSNISYTLGEDKTTDLVTKLVQDQQMALLPTITGIPTAVASGQYLIGIAAPIERDVQNGEPLAYMPLNTKNVPIPNLMTVLKNAPHPNGGAALAYFLSEVPEGQRVLLEIAGYARHDVKGTEIYKLYGGDRGAIPPIDWQVNKAPVLEDKFQKILKGAAGR